MSYNYKNYTCECPIIPRILPAKLVTYNSQNYASTLGSGLSLAIIVISICDSMISCSIWN